VLALESVPTVLGSIGAFTAAIIGAAAYVQRNRIDGAVATREEVKQAFDLQDQAMHAMVEQSERDRAEITRVRERNDAMHTQLNKVIGELAISTSHRQRCEVALVELEDRLHIAEARISELGG
jgi:hypothetical protein